MMISESNRHRSYDLPMIITLSPLSDILSRHTIYLSLSLVFSLSFITVIFGSIDCFSFLHFLFLLISLPSLSFIHLTSRQPIPADLSESKFVSSITKARDSTYMYTSPGTSFVVRIGHSTMTKQAIVDNILAVC